MGKRTSIGLKRLQSSKDADISMAPQKIWSSQNVAPSHLERITSTFDVLMQDMNIKGMDMELQKIIDDNMFESLCSKDQSCIMSGHKIGHRLNNNIILNKNRITDNSKVESQSSNLINDCDNVDEGTTLDKKINYVKGDTFCCTHSEDTMDSRDIELGNQKETCNTFICKTLILDHPYALSAVQTQSATCKEHDIDISSDTTPLSQKIKQAYNPLSLDCNNQKFALNEEATSAMSLDMEKNVLSRSSSTSSLTSDMAFRASHSVFTNDEMDTAIISPESATFNTTSVNSPGKTAVKKGKFRNDTSSSISSSVLALEKFLKCKDHINKDNFNMEIPSDIHLIGCPSSSSSFPNVHSSLLSPSVDWDRSEVNSDIHDDTSDVLTPFRVSSDVRDKVAKWLHPMFLDHDYCVKQTESFSSSCSTSDEFTECKNGKRQYLINNKLTGVKHKKFTKAKYLKKELLRSNSVLNCTSELQTETADHTMIKTNSVGRPKKRPLDKISNEEIDPETGTKLKITGKFQDHYVYYLSKTSRTTSRGRQTSSPALTSDKTTPAQNPGDIVIPHLTDADIEVIRLKGRDALSLTERSNQTSVSSHPLPTHSVIPQSSHLNDFMSDVDSHIVSTILSMESDNLASSATPQNPDIINTGDLNPDQPALTPDHPALTECLTFMKGESNITSEHVLNYLLNVVNNDELLDNGFDTSSSALFSTILPDSINLKAENNGEINSSDHPTSLRSTIASRYRPRHDVLTATKSLQTTSSLDSQSLSCTARTHEPHEYVHTLKESMDESDCLLADLSSFMLDSERTLSQNLVQDKDSHSLVKGTFEDDFKPLEKLQQLSFFQRQTSIEKALDYLCLRDEDIIADSSVFDTRIHRDAVLSPTLTQLTSTFADDSPWIVTVTLYFNDVPAIIINNQPYIRLVDIHKQILPAKDTAILKKRCQLLMIPVLNCTEMQRYFLVQYGRAYNSKSSLIVSKDHATDLVTYYATPQSRVGRASGEQQCRSGPTHNVRLPTATILPAGRNRKHGDRGARRVSESRSLPESDGVSKSSSHQDDTSSAGSHGERTRHKNISYLDSLEHEKNDTAIFVKSALVNTHDEKSVESHMKATLNGTVPYNSKCDITNRKCTSIHKKKIKETGAKSVQKVKATKAMKVNKDKHITEQASYFCLDDPVQDSIDFSRSTKLRPLKLKLKSLLNFSRQQNGSSSCKKDPFFRSNSTTFSTSERPLRVLPVAHQTPSLESSVASQLPSQPADIHLDLFIRSNSACVCCATCNTFLSVPHFMRHHHVPFVSEGLTTEAAQRVLVPRNKENFSQQEMQLWAEFHRLQAAIGGFSETDDETDDDDDREDDSKSDPFLLNISGCNDIDKTLLNSPETPPSSLLDLDKTALRTEAYVEEQALSSLSCTSHDFISGTESLESQDSAEFCGKSVPICNQPLSETQKLSKDTVNKTQLMWRSVDNRGSPGAGFFNGVVHSNTRNTRTSSRKRKSKQLFSIENYDTPKR